MTEKIVAISTNSLHHTSKILFFLNPSPLAPFLYTTHDSHDFLTISYTFLDQSGINRLSPSSLLLTQPFHLDLTNHLHLTNTLHQNIEVSVRQEKSWLHTVRR